MFNGYNDTQANSYQNYYSKKNQNISQWPYPSQLYSQSSQLWPHLGFTNFVAPRCSCQDCQKSDRPDHRCNRNVQQTYDTQLHANGLSETTKRNKIAPGVKNVPSSCFYDTAERKVPFYRPYETEKIKEHAPNEIITSPSGQEILLLGQKDNKTSCIRSAQLDVSHPTYNDNNVDNGNGANYQQEYQTIHGYEQYYSVDGYVNKSHGDLYNKNVPCKQQQDLNVPLHNYPLTVTSQSYGVNDVNKCTLYNYASNDRKLPTTKLNVDYCNLFNKQDPTYGAASAKNNEGDRKNEQSGQCVYYDARHQQPEIRSARPYQNVNPYYHNSSVLNQFDPSHKVPSYTKNLSEHQWKNMPLPYNPYNGQDIMSIYDYHARDLSVLHRNKGPYTYNRPSEANLPQGANGGVSTISPFINQPGPYPYHQEYNVADRIRLEAQRSGSKISPLRLMRKKKLSAVQEMHEQQHQAQQHNLNHRINKITDASNISNNNNNNVPVLDVRRFLATWADEEEENNVDEGQMVVLDCQNIDPEQAELLKLYENPQIRTIQVSEPVSSKQILDINLNVQPDTNNVKFPYFSQQDAAQSQAETVTDLSQTKSKETGESVGDGNPAKRIKCNEESKDRRDGKEKKSDAEKMDKWTEKKFNFIKRAELIKAEENKRNEEGRKKILEAQQYIIQTEVKKSSDGDCCDGKNDISSLSFEECFQDAPAVESVIKHVGSPHYNIEEDSQGSSIADMPIITLPTSEYRKNKFLDYVETAQNNSPLNYVKKTLDESGSAGSSAEVTDVSDGKQTEESMVTQSNNTTSVIQNYKSEQITSVLLEETVDKNEEEEKSDKVKRNSEKRGEKKDRKKKAKNDVNVEKTFSIHKTQDLKISLKVMKKEDAGVDLEEKTKSKNNDNWRKLRRVVTKNKTKHGRVERKENDDKRVMPVLKIKKISRSEDDGVVKTDDANNADSSSIYSVEKIHKKKQSQNFRVEEVESSSAIKLRLTRTLNEHRNDVVKYNDDKEASASIYKESERKVDSDRDELTPEKDHSVIEVQVNRSVELENTNKQNGFEDYTGKNVEEMENKSDAETVIEINKFISDSRPDIIEEQSTSEVDELGCGLVEDGRSINNVEVNDGRSLAEVNELHKALAGEDGSPTVVTESDETLVEDKSLTGAEEFHKTLTGAEELHKALTEEDNSVTGVNELQKSLTEEDSTLAGADEFHKSLTEEDRLFTGADELHKALTEEDRSLAGADELRKSLTEEDSSLTGADELHKALTEEDRSLAGADELRKSLTEEDSSLTGADELHKALTEEDRSLTGADELHKALTEEDRSLAGADELHKALTEEDRSLTGADELHKALTEEDRSLGGADELHEALTGADEPLQASAEDNGRQTGAEGLHTTWAEDVRPLNSPLREGDVFVAEVSLPVFDEGRRLLQSNPALDVDRSDTPCLDEPNFIDDVRSVLSEELTCDVSGMVEHATNVPRHNLEQLDPTQNDIKNRSIKEKLFECETPDFTTLTSLDEACMGKEATSMTDPVKETLEDEIRDILLNVGSNSNKRMTNTKRPSSMPYKQTKYDGVTRSKSVPHDILFSCLDIDAEQQEPADEDVRTCSPSPTLSEISSQSFFSCLDMCDSPFTSLSLNHYRNPSPPDYHIDLQDITLNRNDIRRSSFRLEQRRSSRYRSVTRVRNQSPLSLKFSTDSPDSSTGSKLESNELSLSPELFEAKEDGVRVGESYDELCLSDSQTNDVYHDENNKCSDVLSTPSPLRDVELVKVRNLEADVATGCGGTSTKSSPGEVFDGKTREEIEATEPPTVPNNRDNVQGAGKEVETEPRDSGSKDRNSSNIPVEEPTAGLVEEPTAGLVEEPTAGLVEEPTRGRVEEPTAGFVEEPTPGIVEEPTPGLVEEPIRGRVEDDHQTPHCSVEQDKQTEETTSPSVSDDCSRVDDEEKGTVVAGEDGQEPPIQNCVDGEESPIVSKLKVAESSDEVERTGGETREFSEETFAATVETEGNGSRVVLVTDDAVDVNVALETEESQAEVELALGEDEDAEEDQLERDLSSGEDEGLLNVIVADEIVEDASGELTDENNRSVVEAELVIFQTGEDSEITEVSCDYYTLDTLDNEEACPVNNWPYLEEEVPSSPKREDVPSPPLETPSLTTKPSSYPLKNIPDCQNVIPAYFSNQSFLLRNSIGLLHAGLRRNSLAMENFETNRKTSVRRRTFDGVSVGSFENSENSCDEQDEFKCKLSLDRIGIKKNGNRRLDCGEKDWWDKSKGMSLRTRRLTGLYSRYFDDCDETSRGDDEDDSKKKKYKRQKKCEVNGNRRDSKDSGKGGSVSSSKLRKNSEDSTTLLSPFSEPVTPEHELDGVFDNVRNKNVLDSKWQPKVVLLKIPEEVINKKTEMSPVEEECAEKLLDIDLVTKHGSELTDIPSAEISTNNSCHSTNKEVDNVNKLDSEEITLPSHNKPNDNKHKEVISKKFDKSKRNDVNSSRSLDESIPRENDQKRKDGKKCVEMDTLSSVEKFKKRSEHKRSSSCENSQKDKEPERSSSCEIVGNEAVLKSLFTNKDTTKKSEPERPSFHESTKKAKTLDRSFSSENDCKNNKVERCENSWKEDELENSSIIETIRKKKDKERSSDKTIIRKEKQLEILSGSENMRKENEVETSSSVENIRKENGKDRSPCREINRKEKKQDDSSSSENGREKHPLDTSFSSEISRKVKKQDRSSSSENSRKVKKLDRSSSSENSRHKKEQNRSSPSESSRKEKKQDRSSSNEIIGQKKDQDRSSSCEIIGQKKDQVLSSSSESSRKEKKLDRSSSSESSRKEKKQDRSSSSESSRKEKKQDRSSSSESSRKEKKQDRSSSSESSRKEKKQDRSSSSEIIRQKNEQIRSSSSEISRKKEEQIRSSSSEISRKKEEQDRSSSSEISWKKREKDRSSSSESSREKEEQDISFSSEIIRQKKEQDRLSSSEISRKKKEKDRSPSSESNQKEEVQDRSFSSENSRQKKEQERLFSSENKKKKKEQDRSSFSESSRKRKEQHRSSSSESSQKEQVQDKSSSSEISRQKKKLDKSFSSESSRQKKEQNRSFSSASSSKEKEQKRSSSCESGCKKRKLEVLPFTEISTKRKELEKTSTRENNKKTPVNSSARNEEAIEGTSSCKNQGKEVSARSENNRIEDYKKKKKKVKGENCSTVVCVGKHGKSNDRISDTYQIRDEDGIFSSRKNKIKTDDRCRSLSKESGESKRKKLSNSHEVKKLKYEGDAQLSNTKENPGSRERENKNGWNGTVGGVDKISSRDLSNNVDVTTSKRKKPRFRNLHTKMKRRVSKSTSSEEEQEDDRQCRHEKMLTKCNKRKHETGKKHLSSSELNLIKILDDNEQSDSETNETNERTKLSCKEDEDDERWECQVCGFADSRDRIKHIKEHSFHCQSCYLAFKSEAFFTEHLTKVHKEFRRQDHCLLCELSFDSLDEYKCHLESRDHKHIEAVEKHTINTLFTVLTGSTCPALGPARLRSEWLPNQAGTVHFYHQATPLSLALQHLKSMQEDESRLRRTTAGTARVYTSDDNKTE